MVAARACPEETQWCSVGVLFCSLTVIFCADSKESYRRANCLKGNKILLVLYFVLVTKWDFYFSAFFSFLWVRSYSLSLNRGAPWWQTVTVLVNGLKEINGQNTNFILTFFSYYIGTGTLCFTYTHKWKLFAFIKNESFQISQKSLRKFDFLNLK